MSPSPDRRLRRSGDLAVSLRYLLAAQRERAGLTHIALATMDGILLAWDGDHGDCEELAAYAPFVARGEAYVIDGRRLAGVTVHSLRAGADELVLAFRGEAPHEAVSAAVISGVEGVVRILSQ